jgi:hypothetical protein
MKKAEICGRKQKRNWKGKKERPLEWNKGRKEG